MEQQAHRQRTRTVTTVMAEEANPTVALLPDQESLAKDPKATEDYGPEVDGLLEKLKANVAAGLCGLEEATEEILTMEKKARQACDALAVTKLACYLLEQTKEAGRWPELNDLVVLLSKKRGQLKRVIISMVRVMMSWIDEVPTPEARTALIQTLSSITEGKIFVEVEKARLVRIEAEDLEKEGKVDDAAKLLQEVQVETFGGMERREKTTYILDQLRLVIARKDFVRCQIISKKINPKLLEAEDFQDLKLRYYEYMMIYHLHERDYLNAAKVYWSSFNTPVVLQSDAWKPLLEHYVIYLIMAPHSDESLRLLEELSDKYQKYLSQIPVTKSLVDGFLSTELVDWPLPNQEAVLQSAAFQKDAKAFDVFRSRFIQHNALVLSKYYKRMTVQRAAELLAISLDEVERRVSDLVTDDIIYARLDRPAGIIAFGKPVDAKARLDAWSDDITKLLELLQETSHLISNDRMVHAALETRKELLEKSKA